MLAEYSIPELAQIVTSVFSVLLTGILTLLYYRMYREQQRQSEIQSLPYIPRLKVRKAEVENERGHKSNWIEFENTGKVPFIATIQLAVEHPQYLEKSDSFFDQGSPYESIADESKVFDGGAGDWRQAQMLLNPGEQDRYRGGMLAQELETRETEYQDDPWCLLRLDAELEPTMEKGENHKITRMFLMALGENYLMSPITFDDGVKKAVDTRNLSRS